MKTVTKTAGAAPLLDAYLQVFPLDKWQQFRRNDQDGYQQVKASLIADQRGLCAFCEIDLAQFQGVGLDDFQVEHFFPKSPHQPPPNRSLDWFNLLGACLGGYEGNVGDRERFTSPDLCCGQHKGDANLGGKILDPLKDVPTFPPLFAFDEAGNMRVDPDCPSALEALAQATIDALRLSPAPDKSVPFPRLPKFRKKVVQTLGRQVSELLNSNGNNLEQALSDLAGMYFPANSDVPWPAFFSCIRWYLGDAAEARLRGIGYKG